MSKYINLIILNSILSCGASPSETDSKQAIVPIDECKENCPTTEDKTDTFAAISIDTVIDMPACTAENNRQLVFIVDQKKFYYCKNMQWTETDFTDQLCKADSTIEDDSILTDNIWIDKTTGIRWYISGISGKRDLTICKDGWLVATRDLILAAKTTGIDKALAEVNSGLLYWTTEGSEIYQYLVMGIGSAAERVSKEESYGYLCYKLPE